MANIVEPTMRLKQCVLWNGSIIAQKYKLKILKHDDLRAKIASLKSCDDRTWNEDEFLNALIECAK